MPKCKYCPTEIIWAESSSTGNRAPIEDEADPNGNIRVNEDGTYDVLVGLELEQARGMGELLSLNHFATCEKFNR